MLGEARNKTKSKSLGGTQARVSSKMAQMTSESASSTSAHSTKQKLKLIQPISSGDSDSELTISHTPSQESTSPQSILNQFEKMLHKALKQTSEQISNNLTKEIRDMGPRTAALELKVEEMENSAQDYMSEIDLLKEENFMLQNKLEDYENRARRSNLSIRGIPESVIDVQSTVTALCQELVPGIPLERLEMDRVHQALMPKKVDGPPRDIIAKFHFFRTTPSCGQRKTQLSLPGT